MPTYEYECKSCGHHFETFQHMTDEPLKICPQCGASIHRVINGGVGIIFKGSGFYINDSKGSTATSTLTSSGASDSKNEAKTETASAANAAPATNVAPAANAAPAAQAASAKASDAPAAPAANAASASSSHAKEKAPA